jgi:CIC family chloride channel protein
MPEPRPARGAPAMFRSLLDFMRVPGAVQRFWVLVVATGALAGAGAGALLWLLRLVQRLAWRDAGSFIEAVEAAPPWRRAAVPFAAGLLLAVVFAVWRRLPGGHGTARILQAIWHRGRELSLGRTLARGTLSVVCVGMGASLGREGALVQAGASSGSWLATRFGIAEERTRILVACGAAAGIAAAYDVPIGGALFGLEVLLGSLALELLGPIVVACVVATAVARVVPGSHLAYHIPQVELLHPRELLPALLLAPFLGVAAAIFVRLLGFVEVLQERIPERLRPLLPPLGMGAVGLLAMRFPPVLGNGFDTVQQILAGGLSLGALLSLAALKLGSTAICSGAGVPGGLFTPTLFVGAALGGSAGLLVERAFPGLVPPEALALVGMAGLLSGTTHAAVSAAIIIFEMTGDYGVILPLLLAAAVAAATSRAIEPDSLYTAPLRRRGLGLPQLPRPEWLRRTPLAAVVVPDAARVQPGERFDAVLARLLALPPGHDLYVTGEDATLVGVIHLDALKGTIPDRAHLDMIVANDVVDRTVEPVTGGMNLDEVAARFADSHLERLPVVDGERRLVGTVAMRDVLVRGQF